jgi:hypothetical protein
MQDKPPERISFDQDEPSTPIVNKGIKLGASKARLAKKTEEANIKENFQARAKNAHQKMEGYKFEAVKLAQEFNKIFTSKILPRNKGPIETSLEREILGKLIDWAIMVNNDENEPMIGQGSVGMITLLFNSIIKLRDRNNEVEYQLASLKKDIQDIKSKIDG